MFVQKFDAKWDWYNILPDMFSFTYIFIYNREQFYYWYDEL